MLTFEQLRPGVIYRVVDLDNDSYNKNYTGVLVILHRLGLKVISTHDNVSCRTISTFEAIGKFFKFEDASKEYKLAINRNKQYQTMGKEITRKRDMWPGVVYEFQRSEESPNNDLDWNGCLLTLMPLSHTKVHAIVIKRSPKGFPALGQWFLRKAYKPVYRATDIELIAERIV